MSRMVHFASDESATLEVSGVEVGIRELRDHLSMWVDRVKKGEEIVVTERGKPVARLVAETGHRKLDRLVREGKVRLPTARKRPFRADSPIPTKGSVSEVVSEQRR